MLRNLESALYYGWKPYMHNPKLRQRLHRIVAPTLVVWGEDDRIVSPTWTRDRSWMPSSIETSAGASSGTGEFQNAPCTTFSFASR